MKIRPLCFILLFFFGCFSCIYSPILWADWKVERKALDKVYIISPFRLFYTLEGKNALAEANQQDRNHNGTPDFIEKIAEKLKYAHLVFQDSFRFVSPLHSKRFRNHIQLIDVHFLNIKGNGTSGDGIHRLNYAIFTGKPKVSLIITLSSELKADNLTPEHELFHSFQYGYASFKNKWYMEGMARWSEYVFKNNTGSQKKLPLSLAALDEVLSKAYGAKYFWRRLAYLCDTNKRSYIPPQAFPSSLIKKLYPDIDFKIYGYGFMRRLMENLKEMDQLVTQKRKLKRHYWREVDKKSTINNKYILLAVEKTIKETGYKQDQEMQAFLKVLSQYIQYLDQKKSHDLTEHVEDLGIPYADYYSEGEHIFSRNIWDLHYFKGKLFIGAGNSANAGPSPNSGPVPIVTYLLPNNGFRQEGKVDDEKINFYRTLGKQLYIPGEDATESHQFSNFYQRQPSGEWQKYRTIPKGLHTFDITKYDRRLFAAIGVPKGAAVAVSDNQGNNWQIKHLGSRQRVYNLLKVDGKLYAAKQFIPHKKRDKLTPAEQENYFSLAEYQNGQFIPRPDLDRHQIFPDTYLSHRKTLHISRSIDWSINQKSSPKNTSVYIGANYFNHHFGFYIAESFAPRKIQVKKIHLPQTYKPRDMIVRGNKLYLLCSKEEELETRNIVLEVDRRQLSKPSIKPKELFHFMASTFAQAFEEYSGDFYFGLGFNVKSQRKWSVDEINPDTGKLLRIKRDKVAAQR